MSSNSLRFLTPGKAKYLIAFMSWWAGSITHRGLRSWHSELHFHITAMRPIWIGPDLPHNKKWNECNMLHFISYKKHRTNKDRSVWGTNHDLIRLLDKPGKPDQKWCSYIYENIFLWGENLAGVLQKFIFSRRKSAVACNQAVEHLNCFIKTCFSFYLN